MHKNIITVMLFMALLCACGQTHDNVQSANISKNQQDAAEQNQLNEVKTARIAKEELLPDNVVSELEKAKKNQDFRLFHSKGRRIVIPGLEQLALAELTQLCGTKPLPKSGDVLKNEQHKSIWQKQYNFAKQYNRAMYKICQAR